MQKDLIKQFEDLKAKLLALGTPAAGKCVAKCDSSIQILQDEWTEPKPKEAPATEATTKTLKPKAN